MLFPTKNPPRRVFCCLGTRPTNNPELGFTLLEMAITMVIVGLLLSIVVKALELTASARAKDIITQQTGIGIAFRGFQDRYRALPGDYPGSQASRNIPNIPAELGGDGNGVLLDAASQEQTIAWVHLSQAGFLNARYRMTTPNDAVSDANTPKNIFSAYLQLAQDKDFATLNGDPSATARLNLKTGNAIPVGILAEIDRKIDDGNAARGTFRHSPFNGAATAPSDVECYIPANGSWNVASGTTNCGAASSL